MGQLHLAEESFPASPSAGFARAWFDSSNNGWYQRLDGGRFSGDQEGATIAQIAAHSADTYYKGLQLPSFGMQTESTFEWTFTVTKGAAGVATPVYSIRIGAAGTVADTARLQLTGVLQSAVADSGVVIVRAVCRSVGAAGVIYGSAMMEHNLATTGLASGATSPAGFNLVQAASAGFDNQAGTIGGQFIGLSVNPGAAGAWVVEQCTCKIKY